jgi:uncharacterized protein (DUF1684 family)
MAGSDFRESAAIGLLLLALAAGCQPDAADRDAAASEVDAMEFERINQDWRQRRLERLTEPYGWLSLTGLHLLESGRHSVGSAADNDIVLDRGPARWGVIEVDPEQHVWFEAEAGAGVTLDGHAVERVPLNLGGDAGPTTLEADAVRIHLVEPGGKLALRVRDPEASSRTAFAGLDYYPLDRDWRIEAAFEPHPAGTTLQVANVMGQLIDEPNPGRARFNYQGQSFTLEAVLEDDRLFFIFADRTSGRESYGLGRFLYADLPVDGRVVLDFNQAYNPPCAFNAFTTCPLPPQGNRIDAWVRAGEREYAGPPGIQQPRSPDI